VVHNCHTGRRAALLAAAAASSKQPRITLLRCQTQWMSHVLTKHINEKFTSLVMKTPSACSSLQEGSSLAPRLASLAGWLDNNTHKDHPQGCPEDSQNTPSKHMLTTQY
jgi:hypothetical protein